MRETSAWPPLFRFARNFREGGTIKIMGTLTKSLYDTDFVEWADRTAELLRQGKFEEVDLANVAEEIQDLSNNHRWAVKSQLLRLLKHLVKLHIQPERRGTSWIVSIHNARSAIEFRIDDSPSLRSYAEENLEKVYGLAVRDAISETGLKSQKNDLGIPEKCPWSVDQLLEGDPEALRWE